MKIVVALGGNALLSKGEQANVENQLRNAARAMKSVAMLVLRGHKLVLTFGNGPQVGDIMLRNSAAFGSGGVPLEVSVAESQGQLGFVLELALLNEFFSRHVSKRVASVLTHVLVDKNDVAFANPSKPVGPFYSKKQAFALKKNGIVVAQDAGRGFRMVVASPKPIKVLEEAAILGLFSKGFVVIACGGGGIPVIKEKGRFAGVSAVIDKDLASALLAKRANADVLLLLTSVDNVFLNFGKKNAQAISEMSLLEAKNFLSEGHFLAGSMQPKILAAIDFLQSGGKKVVICSLFDAIAGLDGTAGTTISR